MTELPPSPPETTTREDDLLERVLQRLDHPRLEDPGLDLQGDERRLWREYGELAGLLPYALDPVPPRPSLRDAVLARARGERFAAESRGRNATIAPPAVPRSWPRSARAIAAALAALSVGLAGAGGWLLRERSVQQGAIASLERRLDAAAGAEQELAAARSELARMRSVVTSAGMRICPLRPWGDHPAQPVARAAVYFDAERNQWFLAARDLEPCRKGSSYVLWFMVDGKPVPGGSFRAEKGVPVLVATHPAPPSTSAPPADPASEFASPDAHVQVAGGALQDGIPSRMSGAFLTLEPDPAVEEPTGPPILYGDGAEEML